MTELSKPKPPAELAKVGKAMWNDVVGRYELRVDELRTLEDACSATDMLEDLQKAWRESGRPMMSTGSMGQEVEHPLIGSIDKQRKARQAFLRQLKLPEENSGGGEVNTNPARAAASARWRHGS